MEALSITMEERGGGFDRGACTDKGMKSYELLLSEIPNLLTQLKFCHEQKLLIVSLVFHWQIMIEFLCRY